MSKLLLALLAVALVLFGAVVLPLVLPRHCPVNRVACERIKEGMSQEEVHVILGGPPGDYRTRPFDPLDSPQGGLGSGPPGLLVETWWGDEGIVIVCYTPIHGPQTVMVAAFGKVEPYAPSLVELIEWRLWRLKERVLP
jgi:hypothetical protein